MSIGSISGSNGWQWQQRQAAQFAASSNTSAAPTTSSASTSITNTSSPTAAANVSAFVAAFSADLQSMLTQLGDSAGTSAASPMSDPSATAGAVNQAGTAQAQGAEQHHHHHHDAGGAGDGSSPQDAAGQLVGKIGQSLQGGTLGADQINQLASIFAGDVMRALRSYGTTAAAPSAPSIVA